MKVKACLKTAGSACATGASVVVGIWGAKRFAGAEDTKGKIIAGLETAVGAVGTLYAGIQTVQNVKKLADDIKLSKNSPEAVAQKINQSINHK